MKGGALPAELEAMAGKARRSLRAARGHFETGDYDFACSKAYYAVFHMMQAALLTKGLGYSKHSGAISGFSQHFIRAGTFPRSFGQAIQRLRNHRETGDCAYLVSISKETAKEDIELAEAIVAEVESYLRGFRQQSC